jgi:hypothetical protein
MPDGPPAISAEYNTVTPNSGTIVPYRDCTDGRNEPAHMARYRPCAELRTQSQIV